MAKTENFDDLKRLHDRARIKPAGSRDWMEFATTMMDSWPAIYEKARTLNAELYRLRTQRDALQVALEKAKQKMDSATKCHPNATVHLLSEAYDVIEEAISAEEGCGQ